MIGRSISLEHLSFVDMDIAPNTMFSFSHRSQVPGATSPASSRAAQFSMDANPNTQSCSQNSGDSFASHDSPGELHDIIITAIDIPKAYLNSIPYLHRNTLLFWPSFQQIGSGFTSRSVFLRGFPCISVRNIADDTGQTRLDRRLIIHRFHLRPCLSPTNKVGCIWLHLPVYDLRNNRQINLF